MTSRGMYGLPFILLLIIGLLPHFAAAAAAELPAADVHHSLKLRVNPETQSFSAEDVVTLPQGAAGAQTFVLHEGLSPRSMTKGVTIVRDSGGGMHERYRLKAPAGTKSVRLSFGGKIHHPIEPVGREQARGFSDSPGIISQEGVYLSGESAWYPLFEGKSVSFDLEVALPSGWDCVSQGRRVLPEKSGSDVVIQWHSAEPQEEIFLVAGRFTRYRRPAKVELLAYLRSPDDSLADTYLEAAGRYIRMYEGLLGEYPYAKFALVENFWETGFGMPSFTLLGPRVIRLPFIVNTSYPHEILHNWWGNSVYPDFSSGNWSEGLTAYLSDHLMKEQQGSGAEYRQTTLQKYADYVSGARDFPLSMFRSRHSSSSEAVGYGKSLMFFHMLRGALGDDVFVGGLRDFCRRKRFVKAGYRDLQESFERSSGKPLGAVFRQWVSLPGAPALMVKEPQVRKMDKDYVLSFVIEQKQADDAYRMRLPVAVTLTGRGDAEMHAVTLEQKSARIALVLPVRPVRIDVDPEFDVFRRLDRAEIPPAVTESLGAQKLLILLPKAAAEPMLGAYRRLADALAASGPDAVDIRGDDEVGALLPDMPAVVLGWENRFAGTAAAALAGYDVSLEFGHESVAGAVIDRQTRSVVLAARRYEDRALPLLFIAGGGPDALAAVGRKLPHYHKYSYLVFEGDAAGNTAKGRWPVVDSPMTLYLPDDDGIAARMPMGRLPARSPLVALPARYSAERMMKMVLMLSDPALDGRGLGTAGLEEAARHIADAFKEAGIMPAGDSKESFLQSWEAEIGAAGEAKRKVMLRNIVGIIPGRDPSLSGQCVVVAAHYDHLGRGWPDVRAGNRGKLHPGADDNASGVAVLVELARHFAGKTRPERSIVFAGFTGEEAGRIGSRRFIDSQSPFPIAKCSAMINLDTVGRPAKGRFLVLGAESAAEWQHIFRGAGYAVGVDVAPVTQELDASDHLSFLEAGIPAVQLFGGPHADYHTPSDTADRIDPADLVKAAAVTAEAVEYLSRRREPLTAAGARSAQERQSSSRRTTIGTVPDFGYPGPGVLLAGTTKGSPAEAAGLREGDIIVRIEGREISRLKDLSEALKAAEPGGSVTVVFLRDGEEKRATVEVKER